MCVIDKNISEAMNKLQVEVENLWPYWIGKSCHWSKMLTHPKSNALLSRVFQVKATASESLIWDSLLLAIFYSQHYGHMVHFGCILTGVLAWSFTSVAATQGDQISLLCDRLENHFGAHESPKSK